MAWTDSTIVLAWMTNTPVHFKIFVTNRVAKIKNLIPECTWMHVSSNENPADCVSRGILPSELADHTLYWNGPRFLKLKDDRWFVNNPVLPTLSSMPEVQKINSCSLIIQSDVKSINNWVSRFSSFSRMQRIVVRILRWRQIVRLGRSHLNSGGFTRIELDDMHIPTET